VGRSVSLTYRMGVSLHELRRRTELEVATAAAEMARSKGPRSAGGVLQFAIKTIIVAVIVSASAVFIVNSIVDNVRDALGNTTGRPFWTKLEKELDRAAAPESDLPPEQKEKLLRDIHVIVARWRPFLDAVNSELQKPATAAPNAN
jgi:hypothetical protein